MPVIVIFLSTLKDLLIEDLNKSVKGNEIINSDELVEE